VRASRCPVFAKKKQKTKQKKQKQGKTGGGLNSNNYNDNIASDFSGESFVFLWEFEHFLCHYSFGTGVMKGSSDSSPSGRSN